MTTQQRLTIQLAVVALLILLGLGSVFFWFFPQLKTLRSSIDNDRATISLIQQQQSNLTKLSQTVESIKEKQQTINLNVWSFIKEDDFFTFFQTEATKQHVTIDTPSIADATPNASILPRAVTISLRGPLANCLQAIDDIQSSTPLIAIQQVGLRSSEVSGEARFSIVAATLWQ